jgi:hypothetical protein
VREGGALVVGASEVVFEPPPGLELVSADNRLVLRRPTRPPPLRTDVRGTPPGVRALSESRSTAATVVPAAAAPPAAAPIIPPNPRLPPQDLPPVPEPAGRPADATRDLVDALHRGHVLFEHGDIAAAIEIYDAIVRAHPAVAEPWLFLGIARYAHGDIEEAASALRASLCLDTTLWPAGFYLARAYERLGRRADARQQYDLIAVDELQSFSLLSTSAVINELRAFSHDFRNAARRLSAERTLPPRRPFR